MQTTENYQLKKPEEIDFIDISDLNENTDKIDAALKSIKELGDNLKETKLSKTAKAADSDKLDGNDSLYYATAQALNNIAVQVEQIRADYQNVVSLLNNKVGKTGEYITADKINNLAYGNIVIGEMPPNEATQIGLPAYWYYITAISHSNQGTHRTIKAVSFNGIEYMKTIEGTIIHDWKQIQTI